VTDDPTTAIAHLNRIADAGVKIAIDDYGSGLSSLAYLKQLPAHELKIDRMFVSGLTESHRDPLLVRSSIDLAHAMEMQVTAEGVDDPISLALLKVMGCDLVQGYLISRPLPLDGLISYLVGEHHLEHSKHDPVEQQRRHLTALVGRD
jgi:EAL domain-containing protein (putative c-di-GMP-specific phosphodiesterase class I)